MTLLLIYVYTILVLAGIISGSYLGSIGKIDINIFTMVISVLIFAASKLLDNYAVYSTSVRLINEFKKDSRFPSLADNTVSQFQCKLNSFYSVKTFEYLTISYSIISVLAYISVGYKYKIIWVGIILQVFITFISCVVSIRVNERAVKSEFMFRTFTSRNEVTLEKYFGFDKASIVNLSFEEQCIAAFSAYKKDTALLSLVNNITSVFVQIMIELFMCILYAYFTNELSSAFFASGCIIGLGNTFNNLSVKYRGYLADRKILSDK